MHTTQKYRARKEEETVRLVKECCNFKEKGWETPHQGGI